MALLALYAATLAPGVTFWDAGEFIAAAHTLGIPHPPGTPLFVLVGHVWGRALAPLGAAVASNLLSATCTAAAGGLLASLIAAWTGRATLGVAAALGAGSMATVWLDATETEVYAAALLLSWLMLWSADRAGRTGETRWTLLTAYLFALAVPLHLSALVAAPAALLLAATARDGAPRWRAAGALGAAFLVAVAVGTASVELAVLAAVALVVAAVAGRRLGPPSGHVALLLVVLVGLSALAFLLVRARHDPAINQGNPATLEALIAQIGRRQYQPSAPWPRQAPLWLQLGNLFEYADWQVALGLAPGVLPSPLRTPITVLHAALAVLGAVVHRRVDRRSWRAMLLLLVCASVGVALWLNLKAGPSFGWGVLPDDAPREARERDYFFALAFWCWGAWAGLGAAWLVARAAGRRRRLGVALGLVAAALPAALNWRAVTRRTEPDASLPRVFAAALLASAPPHAVLFAGGDNDSYPLWYLQEVERVRRDVVVVTIPLLGAPWYREQLATRHALGDAAAAYHWRGVGPELAALAAEVRRAGRPVAIGVGVEAAVRAPLGRCWTQRGMVYVAADGPGQPCGGADATATAAVARLVAPAIARPPREQVDATPEWVHRVLGCPAIALRAAAHPGLESLLDSTCNRR